MAAKVDTSAFRTPGGWLNLQGAKFKYLGDKVNIINSLKFVQEIDDIILPYLRVILSGLCSHLLLNSQPVLYFG